MGPSRWEEGHQARSQVLSRVAGTKVLQRCGFATLSEADGHRGGADQSLSPDDGRVHFRVFLEKYIICYINGHHKQYVLVDTIFNYMFYFGLPATCLHLSPQHSFLAPAEAAPERCVLRKVYAPDCPKDMLRKVRFEKSAFSGFPGRCVLRIVCETSCIYTNITHPSSGLTRLWMNAKGVTSRL